MQRAASFCPALLCALLLSAGVAEGCQRRENRGCSIFHKCCSPMRCEAGSQKCRAPGEEGDPCHLTRPCGTGFNCEAGTHVCRGPGREGDPCHLTRPCGAGLKCEAGTHVCRGPGSVGDPCHLTRQCADGLSCQPGVQRCYHKPRRVNEPCSAGYNCGPGLRCEAGTQKCRQPGERGDPCHVTRPCADGLSCQPFIQRCYTSPRLFREPCSLGFSCGPGLSCHPFLQKCFHKPRRFNEPCSAGFGCGPGLKCVAGVQKCTFKTDNPMDTVREYNSSGATTTRTSASGLHATGLTSDCNNLYQSHDAATAKKMGRTMTLGGGVAISGSGNGVTGVSVTVEMGVAYGASGQYGCYVTHCQGVGFAGNGMSAGFLWTTYRTWNSLPGPAYALSAGVSLSAVPGVSLGLGYTVISGADITAPPLGHGFSVVVGYDVSADAVVPVAPAGTTSLCYTWVHQTKGIRSSALQSSQDSACQVVISKIPDAPDTVLNLNEVRLYTRTGDVIPSQELSFALSSTYTQEGKVLIASLCNDGITTGIFPNLCHTAVGDAAPNLTISFNCAKQLGWVEVFNRKDCCSDRIASFQLTAADKDGNEYFPPYTFTGANATYTVPEAAKMELGITNPGADQRCKVVFSLAPDAANTWLNLGEVDLYTPVGTRIAASDLVYVLSSTERNGTTMLSAGNCNDDNISGKYPNLCHTAFGDPNPTLSISYPCNQALGWIEVFNRDEACCKHRINNFQLRVLDADGLDAMTPYRFAGSQTSYTVPESAVTDFQLIEGVSGNFVLFLRNANWKAAQRLCYEEEMEPAKIWVAGDAQAIRAGLDAKRLDYVWTGANDVAEEMRFVWADKTAVPRQLDGDYNLWGTSEPNNLYGDEDCGAMTPQGTLVDDNCDTPRYMLCQPEPISIDGASATYQMFQGPRTWSQALEMCQARGMSLAKLQNVEDVSQIQEALREHGLFGELWVGANDRASERTWQWSDKSTVPNKLGARDLWGQGRPLTDTDDKDCAVLAADGFLYDVSCDGREAARAILCQPGLETDAELSSVAAFQASLHSAFEDEPVTASDEAVQGLVPVHVSAPSGPMQVFLVPRKLGAPAGVCATRGLKLGQLAGAGDETAVREGLAGTFVPHALVAGPKLPTRDSGASPEYYNSVADAGRGFGETERFNSRAAGGSGAQYREFEYLTRGGSSGVAYRGSEDASGSWWRGGQQSGIATRSERPYSSYEQPQSSHEHTYPAHERPQALFERLHSSYDTPGGSDDLGPWTVPVGAQRDAERAAGDWARDVGMDPDAAAPAPWSARWGTRDYAAGGNVEEAAEAAPTAYLISLGADSSAGPGWLEARISAQLQEGVEEEVIERGTSRPFLRDVQLGSGQRTGGWRDEAVDAWGHSGVARAASSGSAAADVRTEVAADDPRVWGKYMVAVVCQ